MNILERSRITMLALALVLASSPLLAQVDRDGNPPGPAGGAGTNWENRPGAKDGPGTSPDREVRVHGKAVRFAAAANGYWYHPEYGYWRDGLGFWDGARRCWIDNDSNPPGRAGGRGSNWENPPGLAGGAGTSPDRYGRCS